MGNYERIHDKRFGMGPRHSEIYLDQLLADLLSKASNMMKRGEYPCFAEEYYPYEEEKAKSYGKFIKSIHRIIKNNALATHGKRLLLQNYQRDCHAVKVLNPYAHHR